MTDGRRDPPKERREPAFEPPRNGPTETDIRLTADDRPGPGRSSGPGSPGRGGQKPRPGGRREPNFAPTINPALDPIAEGRRPKRAHKAADAGSDDSRDGGREQPPEDEDAADVQDGMTRANGRGGARQAPRGSSQGSSRPAGRGKVGVNARAAGKRRRGGGRSLLGHLAYWSVVLGLWAFIGVLGLFVYHASKLPPIDQLAVPKRPPNIAILASDGSLLANRGETGGRTVTLKELPPYLPKAFVAIEDRRFFAHWGIDPVGIARAIFRNVTRSGSSMQGGSTLTQQLAKNLFLTQERTASRKIQEAILALWLERNYSKDQILELYLNRVYFGSGSYGVEAAAQKYFGKSARSVTLSEAAVLAGLVQAPSRLAPNRNPEAAQARAALVLASMAKEGLVSDQMAKVALMNPPDAVKPPGAGSVNYAADYVMDVLDDFIGSVDKDIVVTTTIDPAMQVAAEKSLVDELAQKGDKYGVSQGAFVALQPDGAVRALVGGRSYTDSQFNRATAAKRQPGSAFKPFVYLTAVEHGLTPDTIRDDAPINIKGWQPENYSRDYRGPVSLRTGLALSLNTVAVRLGVEVGPKNVVKTAQRMGIQSKLEPNASIALGTSEVTPLELVNAYTPFANGGIAVLPYVIKQVKTSSGDIIYSRSGPGLGRVLDLSTVGMMNAMMRETLLTGTARKAELPGWEAAGKTGTSQEFRDAWFVGYTSALVAGVWLGNDDGTPTRKVSGGNLPVEVWARFMKTALAGTPPSPLPGGQWKQLTPAPVGDPNFQPAPPVAGLAPDGTPLQTALMPPQQAPAQRASAATGAGPLVIAPVPPANVPNSGWQASPQPAQQAGVTPQRRQQVQVQAEAEDAPRPPGMIPGAGPAPGRTAPPPRERNLLDRLFGG
jgi:penicillin-binding protein 1A